MIRTNKKIGMVYCDNSKKYVEEFEKVIMEKKGEGYCIETLVVDNKLIDSERMIEERVFANLNKCDYGIVFLTKDLKIEKRKFISKPNVLLELGYLRGRLKRDRTWCITDFPHKEIESQTYMMPSDFVGEVIEEIDVNNYKRSIRNIVDKFITAHSIIKFNNYNANDLVNSLILNPFYKTDYGELFSNRRLEIIEKYSIKCQLEEIFKLWTEEKEKLNDVEQIIYLYERIVFLPFFSREITYGKLNDFLSVKNEEESEVVFSCRKILRCINEYENYKRTRQQYGSAEFYLNKANEMQQELDRFKDYKVAPIIECVTKNYIGLSYLNFYFASQKRMENKNVVKQNNTKRLKLAKDNFERVIELSEKKFSDKVEIFQAFSDYNLARVKRRLNIDANDEYNKAIDQRRILSEASCLPKIFRLIFSLERIHAEIDYYDYMKEMEDIDLKTYIEKIETVSEELRNMNQTPVVGVSLFETLENKIKSILDGSSL